MRRLRLRLAGPFLALAALAATVACGASGTSSPDLGDDSSGRVDAGHVDASARADSGTDATTTPFDAESGDDASSPSTDAASNEASSPQDSGSGSNEDGGAIDAALDAASLTDANDAGDANATNDAAADGGIVVTQLDTGADALYGVTDDGYAIVYDSDSGTLEAIPLAGGSAIALSTTVGALLVHGNDVLIWENVSTTSGLGSLNVWSSALGIVTLVSTTTSIANVAAISASGSQLIYTSGASYSAILGTKANLIGADGTSFGTTHTLVGSTGFGLGDGISTCTAQIGFAGNYAVAAYCALNAGSAAIKSWNTASSWTSSSLATNAYAYWAADNAGTEIAIVSTANAASLITLATSASTPLGSSTSVYAPYLSADGTTAFLQIDSTNAFQRSPISAISFANVVSSGFATFRAVSSDWTYAYYASNAPLGTDGTPASYGDLRFVDISAANQTPITLVSVASGNGGVFGDAFTADNTELLYFTGIDETTLVGTLTTQTIAGNSQRTFANAWIDYATTGTKIVFSDNHVAAAGNSPAREDLHAVDVATSDTPSTIATGADSAWFLTHARDKIVYTDSNSVNTQGLYVQTLP